MVPVCARATRPSRRSVRDARTGIIVLTVDFAEREPVDDHPEVVEERQRDDHVPVVAQLAGGVEHERPPYALDAVGRPVPVLPGPAVFLPAAVEADGTARVVVRRAAGRASTASAGRPAASAAATTAARCRSRRRRRRSRRGRRSTGTDSASGATAATAAATAAASASSARSAANTRAGAVKVHPARSVLTGRRLAARLGRDVRVRTGYAARQTAGRPATERRRQRIPRVGETSLRTSV